MTNPEVSRRTLELLVERLGQFERAATELIREAGSGGVLVLLNTLQQVPDKDVGLALFAGLAELGILHALRLHLSGTLAVSQPSMN